MSKEHKEKEVLEVNEKLCEALGVDLSKKDVQKVVLTIKAHEHPVVAVTRTEQIKCCLHSPKNTN